MELCINAPASRILRHVEIFPRAPLRRPYKLAGGPRRLCELEHTRAVVAMSMDAARSVMKRVLDGGSFRLRCQRMQAISAVDGGRPHYEVLLSVLHDGAPRISPQRFVLAAERCAVMALVDQWVIRNTLDWLERNRLVFSTVAGFAINLSGQSLDDPDLSSFIAQEIRRTSIPAHRLAFEITETSPLTDLSRAAATVRAIQRLGARVCIDDFGKGYAGELYVRRLAPDVVKFETSLLGAGSAQHAHPGMARWLRSYCSQHGIRTVAECVEDRGTVPALRALGVDYVQGFAIEKPTWLDALG